LSTFVLLVRDSGKEPALRIEAQSGIEIGRSPECRCVLSDPNVGRKAAKIVEHGGVFYVEDMGSTNRTAIRGLRKLSKGEREALRHGLVIEVGRSSIEIEEIRAVPDDKTDAGIADGGGGDDETGFGEKTLVAGAASPMTRPAPAVPDQSLDDAMLTMRGPSTPAPTPAPPPPKRAAPTPAPAPPRPAPAPAPTRAQAPAPAPAPAPPRPATAAPEPALEPAPRPVPRLHESSHSSTADFMGPGGIGSGTQNIRPDTGDLGALGTMITKRPRLVIVNEADRRIVNLERLVTMVGRESGECRIDHKAISQPHAMIRFVSATNNFQIEDRKSRNQTFVGGIALNPEVPQLLPPESLVRFGAIEAVFVVDRDSENAAIPPAQYAAAVRYLIANNQITQEQARAAQEEAKLGAKHVGEALMIAGVVSARNWTRAFENGKTMAAQEVSQPRSRRALWMIVTGVVVVLLVLAWVFRAKLGFGGE